MCIRDSDKAALAHLYLGNKVTEQERLRLLKSIARYHKVTLYTGSDVSGLPQVEMRGLAKTMTEMPKIFHLSKINLNFTSKPIRTGLPLRIWDIFRCRWICPDKLSDRDNRIL